MNKINILLLEDDPIIGDQIQLTLNMNDFDVTWVQTIPAFREYIQTSSPHLAIFDVNIGEDSSIDLFSELQKSESKFPVIFLSANGSDENIIKALELGANDFIHKPIKNKELLLRIKTHIKLLNIESTPNEYIFENVILDMNQKCITYEDKSFTLNQRQLDIMQLLYQAANKILKRDDIFKFLLETGDGKVDKRTVDAHVSQIRKKFREAGIRHISIESVYRIGYRLSNNED